MGNNRNVNYQWVEDGLFEVSERYGEHALRLLQDTDDDEQVGLLKILVEIVNEHTDKIEKLMQGSTSVSIKGSLNFERHDRTKIPSVFLQELVPLLDNFRSKVIAVSRKKSILERMDYAPLMIGGVLRCINDMRERIQGLFEKT